MNKNALNSVKLMKLPSSVVSLDHDHKLSCSMGKLIPVLNEDCIPGDRWTVNFEALIRLAPLVSPMMHLVNVFFHCYFVPYRLLWPNFENYMTGTKVGGFDPACPFFYLNDELYSQLQDHLGFPFPDNGSATNIPVNVWHNAAYQFIYNEYYRDQRLQAEVDYSLVDGNNTGNGDLFEIRYRAWEHDYLTSCLPSPQAIDGVNVPLGDVELKNPWYNGVPLDPKPRFLNTAQLFNAGDIEQASGGGIDGITVAGGGTYAYDPEGTLQVAPTSIRNLRLAFKLQEFLERQNVSGNRYSEFNYGMFGVTSQDARLQRPEYIGGAMSPIRISEVLNTTGTDDLPQGNMAGHGVAAINGYPSNYFVREHGCIMCLMSVMPKPDYFQGVPKKFLKTSNRYESFFQQFEHIGDKEVKNIEASVTHTTPFGTFGYNPAYMEYKTFSNRISGQFKTSLLHWTMARDLPDDVDLNDEFIRCVPTDRVFAVTDENVDKLYCHIRINGRVRRLMSRYSTPHM